MHLIAIICGKVFSMMVFEAFSSLSSPFVEPLFPGKGEKTSFSIAFSSCPDAVYLKTDSDLGLVWQTEMELSGMIGSSFLYTAQISMPRTLDRVSYFFAYILNGRSYYYSKKGITRHCPSRNSRFTLVLGLDAPEWVARSTCYQIFPDRFSDGHDGIGAVAGEYEFDGGTVSTPSFDSIPEPFEKSRCLDFYNGDLKGIEDRIGYLKELGINAVYLNPIYQSRTVHRYDAEDFFHVDEKLGGDKAFESLARKLHENGIRVIVDISINHTGPTNEWLRKAKENPDSEEHGFYYFDRNGNPRLWQNVRTLIQLNYSSQRLRDLIYRGKDSVMQKYLSSPYLQDGWRLDVSPEVGRTDDDNLCYEIWREVRKSLKSVRKDLYLVGEDWDDSREYLEGDMWDATMNYYGAGRLVRSWLGERDRFLTPGWGHSPIKEDEWTAFDLENAINEYIMSQSDQMKYFQMNLVDSHDTPRLHNNREVYRKDLYLGAIMLLFFLPGMPSIYYGDEIALDGELGSVEASRYPMCWDESKWDMETLDWHKGLAAIRNQDWFGYSAFRVESLDRYALSLFRFDNDHGVAAIMNNGPKREACFIPFPFKAKDVRVLMGEGAAYAENGNVSVMLETNKSIVLEIV